MLESNSHVNSHLQNAYNKDKQHFKTEILKTIVDKDSEVELQKAIETEQLLIDQLYHTNCLYNISQSAVTGVATGNNHHLSGVNWLKEVMTDEQYREHLLMRSEASLDSNNSFYGRSHSDESKIKLSKIQSDRMRSGKFKSCKRRPIRIEDKYFRSIAEAKRYWRKEYKMGHSRFDRYIRDNLFDYEFITEEDYLNYKSATTIENTDKSGSE